MNTANSCSATGTASRHAKTNAELSFFVCVCGDCSPGGSSDPVSS